MYLNILKIILGGPVHRTDGVVAEIPDENLSMCIDDESLNQEEQRQRIRMHPRACCVVDLVEVMINRSIV